MANNQPDDPVYQPAAFAAVRVWDFVLTDAQLLIEMGKAGPALVLED